MIEFSENLNRVVYLIHDNAQQFKLNHLQYNIKQACTSVNAPNMDSGAERFVKSARTEYIEYYNALKPHQGINKNIAKGYEPKNSGRMFYHYERRAA